MCNMYYVNFFVSIYYHILVYRSIYIFHNFVYRSIYRLYSFSLVCFRVQKKRLFASFCFVVLVGSMAAVYVLFAYCYPSVYSFLISFSSSSREGLKAIHKVFISMFALLEISISWAFVFSVIL